MHCQGSPLASAGFGHVAGGISWDSCGWRDGGLLVSKLYIREEPNTFCFQTFKHTFRGSNWDFWYSYHDWWINSPTIWGLHGAFGMKAHKFSRLILYVHTLSSLPINCKFLQLEKKFYQTRNPTWLNFFLLILEIFAHFSYKLPIWVSLCPDEVSFCPEYHHQPLFFIQQHKPLLGICTYTKRAKSHPKTTLFLAWTWKWAKWTTFWAKWTPTGQNVWKWAKLF